MKNEDNIREVFEALERYFHTAKPNDDKYNKSIIKYDLDRYGKLLIQSGFVFIANHIEYIGPDEKYTLEKVIGIGTALLQLHHSLVKASGKMGINAIFEMFENYSDEDAPALAAYMLAAKDFAKINSMLNLKMAYLKAYGTAYKLALALAIYRQGDKDSFKELAYKFIMEKPSPEFEDQILETAVPTVLPMIILDIASNGKAYDGQGKKYWRRKF